MSKSIENHTQKRHRKKKAFWDGKNGRFPEVNARFWISMVGAGGRGGDPGSFEFVRILDKILNTPCTPSGGGGSKG